ncbi:MAG: diguanylate cyclase [Halothiobacillaceae bacterium]
MYNRRAFDEDWSRLQQETNDSPLALLLLDCDFFKSINDTYGHETGDRVLQDIARLVSEELRRDDRLYRLGGDEFLAILWGAGEVQALQVAERCRMAVANHPVENLGIKERLRISIGVVAEGIETESQRQDFQRLGVGYLQGWAFGRPRTTGATRARPVSGGLIAVGAADQEEGKKMVGVTGFEPTTPTSRT